MPLVLHEDRFQDRSPAAVQATLLDEGQYLCRLVPCIASWNRRDSLKCVGMEGVIKEGAEALQEEGDDALVDLGIIGAGSRVEHYEMAGYLTAINLAKRMGQSDVVSLLQESLAEEEAAENKLRGIASGLLKKAPAEERVGAGG